MAASWTNPIKLTNRLAGWVVRLPARVQTRLHQRSGKLGQLHQEIEARNRELTEALEQQTATSAILRAIAASPADIQPVLNAVAESATKLCDAYDALILLKDGETLAIRAHHGPIPYDLPKWPIARDWVSGRAFLDRKPVYVDDLSIAGDDFPAGQEMAIRMGHRTTLATPLLREDEAIGAIVIRRLEVRPFNRNQIELLSTFADQAVIAIENVRLFQEVQERNRELTEALEQQTATSAILRAIAASPTDIQPVLNAVAESAAKLCNARDAAILLKDGEALAIRAHYGSIPIDFVKLPIGRDWVAGCAFIDKKPVHVDDVTTVGDSLATSRRLATQYGHRTTLATPLLREDEALGVLVIRRVEVRPFNRKQIDLLTTFADQAVIAIENVRLFQEVQERTAELARSVGELEALGEVSQAVNSTLDLDTVLKTIVAKAVQLSGTDAGTIYVFSSTRQQFRLRATYGMSDDLIAAISSQTIGLNDPGIGDAARRRAPVQLLDLADGPPTPTLKAVLDAGYRSVLVVPLLRPNKIVGALVVRRRKPGEFDDQVIHLMETFAAQSVLAIQNAKLFREIDEKGHELEAASRHKSQFLANMSHELRTPLNSVLGFTELLVDGIYGELPDKAKATILRVQANGRHLLGLINDVLDLSKIEAGQLTLMLDDYSVAQIVRSAATAVEPLARSKGLSLSTTIGENLPIGRGDERRLTQVLLNLAGNAVKFTEAGAVDILAVAVDGHFEIVVRDTGRGIAAADQLIIFDEFQQVDDSSTRQKGGTGLGLAISKRIVEMHGGTIGVESVPGSGSTFKMTIPINAEERVRAA
jgi:signal transduction histidine kinase